MIEEQSINILDFIRLVLFLGSITYLLGFIFQFWVIYSQEKAIKIKTVLVLIITRLFSILMTFVIWAYWTTKIDIMFTFVLLPAFVAELIFIPVFLKLFGYNLFRVK